MKGWTESCSVNQMQKFILHLEHSVYVVYHDSQLNLFYSIPPDYPKEDNFHQVAESLSHYVFWIDC